jgi:DNA-binding Lrp family transcriptional regulator
MLCLMAKEWCHAPTQYVRPARPGSKIYVEAGDSGRIRAQPGQVLVHNAHEAHQDDFSSVDAQVLNIPLVEELDVVTGTVKDPDAIARLAERDIASAAALLKDAIRPLDGQLADWPDKLAAALACTAEFNIEGVARNPADRWRKSDDGMHVLAAALYGLLRQDRWIETGGSIEAWLADARPARAGSPRAYFIQLLGVFRSAHPINFGRCNHCSNRTTARVVRSTS